MKKNSYQHTEEKQILAVFIFLDLLNLLNIFKYRNFRLSQQQKEAGQTDQEKRELERNMSKVEKERKTLTETVQRYWSF